jgi:hypothetical protein
MTLPGEPRDKVSSLAELPQSIEPPRDLWPQIEARLRDTTPALAPAPAVPRYRRAAQLRWLAAAAMVATLAVGMWIGRTLLPAGTPGAPLIASNPPAAYGGNALDASYVSDPRYERQRAALLSSLQTRLATMNPQTRTKVMASLATIEKAKQDLEQALGKDPGNALLQELLVNTYQDEMRVLTDVHEASDPGRGI